MQKPPSMKDVAQAAGVSRSTVHNAIHRPLAVAPDTQQRVQAAMAALNFDSGQQKGTHGTRQLTAGDSAPHLPDASDTGLGTSLQEKPAIFEDSSWLHTLRAGDRVQIIHNGQVSGAGSIDALMDDGSVVWLWQDNGLGRMMVVPGEGTRLMRLARADQKPART